MSTKTRNLSNIDGANVGNPDESDFSSNGIGAYPNDAAFEAMLTPVAGSLYFNTTENCLREYNGTSWQYDKSIFSTQTDATTTGSNQDITPSVDQIIRFTHGSLASIRGIIPTTQKVLYLVNDQASQSITVQNQAAGATAANRIITGNGADLVVMAGRVIGLVYDEDATRWRVVSGRVPSSALEVHASDAAYQTAHPGFGQGAEYFNSVSLLVRQYNGTAWQNDKTSYETQTDSTTTGASQDISPNTSAQVIRFTHGSLTSIRSIVPTNQTVVYFVNGQASQVITIKNEDTGATAANRIVTGTGADFSLAVGQMIALVYDAGGTRWRLAGAASSGSSGTDGINLIGSPSTATGWTATNLSGSVCAAPVTTAVSGDLPLAGATNSAIQLVATGSGAENNNYWSYPVTTSAAMNGSLQVDLWIRPGTGFVANEWTLSVYQGTTRQALRHDVSSISYLPNGIVRYTTSFDAIAGTAYTKRFARISGSGSATLNFCNSFLGWPFVSNTAAVGKWAVDSLIIPTNFGTLSNQRISSKQDTDTLHARGTFDFGTLSAGLKLAIGSGRTINSLVLPTPGNTAAVGRWVRMANGAANISSTDKEGIIFFDGSDTSNLYFAIGTSTYALVKSDTFVSNNERLYVEFSVPIAEWAGAVSTGPAPAEEFAYSTDTTTTAGNTQSDNGLYGYGPTGTSIVSIDSNTASNVTIKRVRFQYPIQADDELAIELLPPSNTYWIPLTTCDSPSAFRYEGTGRYGMGLVRVSGSSTDVYVTFGNGSASPYKATSKTYQELNADPWSGYTGWKWRVRKTKKASLPFANAGTDGSSGLVAPYTEGVGVVYAGRYTPTLTNGTNIAGSTSASCMYMRVGKVVTVSGYIACSTTAAASTPSLLGISLPIASNFTASSDCAGTGTRDAASGTQTQSCGIQGDAANDRASLFFNSAATTNLAVAFSFQYEIK